MDQNVILLAVRGILSNTQQTEAQARIRLAYQLQLCEGTDLFPIVREYITAHFGEDLTDKANDLEHLDDIAAMPSLVPIRESVVRVRRLKGQDEPIREHKPARKRERVSNTIRGRRKPHSKDSWKVLRNTQYKPK